ncbi:MAG: hypothetical protein JRF54_13595 [Deltaproteobacteria bacterium]|nr:hypothetical protein [Deltaproteobacteria bacterium]
MTSRRRRSARLPSWSWPTNRTECISVTSATSSIRSFVVMANEPNGVHFSYQRYVVNQIRKRFGFRGTPIRVRYRGKKKREKK